MKTRLLLLAGALTSALAAPMLAQPGTFVNWSNSPGYELLDFDGIALSEGLPKVATDGALVQLGYFSEATTVDPFAGEWVALPLVSYGPDWTWHIGMKASRGDGLFSASASFFPGDTGPIAAGTPLAIRFFDASSEGESTYYNTVSGLDAGWGWILPEAGGSLTLSLADSTLVWEGGAGSAFRTVIPIPEPAAVASLLGLAALVSARMLRRRKAENWRAGG